jgi:hypothetical protein
MRGNRFRQLTAAAGRKRAEEARAQTPPGQQPTVGRHIINNRVIKVDGNKAHGVAYWASGRPGVRSVRLPGL